MMENTGKTDSRDLIWAYEKDQIVLKTVYELLECPVCLTMMFPPIHQCSCSARMATLYAPCRIRVRSRCPMCRTDMGNIRCLALEKIAKPLEVPFECPDDCPRCSVTGNIPELVTHLKDDHRVMHDGTILDHSFVLSHPHKMQNARWKLNVINCYGRQFCLHFQSFSIGKGVLYIAFVRFMGENVEADNFSYLLEVSGSHQKSLWEGVPRSIRDGHQKVRDDLDGLLIAPFFWDGNELELQLQIKVKIFVKQ